MDIIRSCFFKLSFTMKLQICLPVATSGAGTSYPLGAPEFTHYFSGERVTRSLVMFCTSLFDIFLLAIVLLGLRFTNSDYPFGIFQLFPNTKSELG